MILQSIFHHDDCGVREMAHSSRHLFAGMLPPLSTAKRAHTAHIEPWVKLPSGRKQEISLFPEGSDLASPPASKILSPEIDTNVFEGLGA